MPRSLLVFLATLPLYSSAQEFWLNPDKFFYKRGETINLRFYWGENFEGTNWEGNRTDVKNMNFYFGGVKDSCHRNLSQIDGDSLQLAMLDEGTAMMTMTTQNSFFEQDAKDFNDFLREHNLQGIIDWRIKNNDTTRKGLESYQRCNKTIIQVGDSRDKTYKNNTGLTVEIIPDDHPYHVAKDDDFKVKLLYKNNPVPNHQVRVWHRQNNRTTVQIHKTDENGEVKFFLTPSGKWMITAIIMTRLEKNEKADWQSHWGSLTWGYE